MDLSIGIKMNLRLGNIWNVGRNKNFKEAAMQVITAQADRLSAKTTANRTTALYSMLEYAGNGIKLKDINGKLLLGYDQWLRRKGLRDSTIACYHRCLRSVLSQLRADSVSLYRNLYTGVPKNEKRAISSDDISRMQSCEFPAGTFKSLALNFFLCCFYLRGLAPIDLALLRRSDIHDGYIFIARHKTKQSLVIKLEHEAESIINMYARDDCDYVWPFIDAKEQQEALNQYNRFLNRYNRVLKQIAIHCGIKARLTSYVPRHSWATIAAEAGVKIETIADALAHTKTSTTQRYIKAHFNPKVDEANRLVLSLFRCKT